MAEQSMPEQSMPEAGDDLVQKVEGDNTTWVEIASFGTIEEANLFVGFLEAEGIDAHVENVQSEVLPANFGLLGDIRVYVPKDQEIPATELMHAREQEAQQLDDDDNTIITDDGIAEIDENAESEPEPEK
jgi:hypothetical protein